MLLDLPSQLPVEVMRFDGESGIGHVMRAFWANGMSMTRVYEWLHVRLGKPLRDVDARVLAWVVQAPPEWLAERLFMAPGAADDRRVRLGARTFSAAPLLMGKTARICPRCLSELGFCDLGWSFKFAPTCPKHGVPLLGACVHCKRTISWDRPQIDICRCGRYYKPAHATGEPPPAALAWALWVRARLSTGAAPGQEDGIRVAVPRMLDELSLDGAFRLVEAFGFFEEADEQPLAAASTARSIAGAISVIVRGLERLMLIDGNLGWVRDLGPRLHIAALERLRAYAVDAADANCAALLLRNLGDCSGRDVDMRGRHARGQMALFN